MGSYRIREEKTPDTGTDHVWQKEKKMKQFIYLFI